MALFRFSNGNNRRSYVPSNVNKHHLQYQQQFKSNSSFCSDDDTELLSTSTSSFSSSWSSGITSTTGTISSSTIRTPKSVSFSSASLGGGGRGGGKGGGITATIIPIPVVTKEEAKNIWYTDVEYRSHKKDIAQTVTMMQKKQPINQNEMCKRGLENMSNAGSLLRKIRRNYSVKVVLELQAKQKQQQQQQQQQQQKQKKGPTTSSTKKSTTIGTTTGLLSSSSSYESNAESIREAYVRASKPCVDLAASQGRKDAIYVCLSDS